MSEQTFKYVDYTGGPKLWNITRIKSDVGIRCELTQVFLILQNP
jgi:hypothetical protein